MSDQQKAFLYNLAIVVISAVLSFLVQYVTTLKAGVEGATLGAGFSSAGVALRKHILRV